MSETIKNKAHQVATNLFQEQGVAHAEAFDPLIILTIIGIIINLICLIRECKKSKSAAVDLMHNPGILASWRLRRVVRRALSKHPLLLMQYHPMVVAGVKAVGKTVTEAEFTSMLEEASL